MIPEVPAGLAKTELLVLMWTGHYFGPDYLTPRVVANPQGDDVRMVLTEDRTRLRQADAVWFHAPSIGELPREKRQPWVLMSMESEVNCPSLRDPLVRRVFDLHMTYRLDSDVPCLYPNWHQYGTFLEPPVRRAGPSRGATALYVASNPVPDRDDYVAELMQTFPVDCLGGCLNNRRVQGFANEGEARAEQGWSSLNEVLPGYKFYLAFENSRTVDYVTEKVYRALAAGVVPVYRGAPNVRELMPADDAVLVADDFESPAALGEHLCALDHDDAAYARHLRWKREGYSPRFRRLVDLGSVEPMLRLAVKLAHGCGRECRCGGRQRDREDA